MKITLTLPSPASAGKRTSVNLIVGAKQSVLEALQDAEKEAEQEIASAMFRRHAIQRAIRSGRMEATVAL